MALSDKDLQAVGTLLDKKLEDRLNALEARLDQKLDQKLAPIKKDLSHIKKSVNLTLKYVDDQDKDIKKRVKRLEKVAASL